MPNRTALLPLLARAGLTAALVLGPFATAVSGTEPLPPVDPAELDAFLDERVPQAMEAADVPGLAFAFVQVVDEGSGGEGGGPLVHLRGWGLADVEAETPVDPERTVFRVGSIAKPLTSTTVLAVLEEHPELGLDSDLRPLLGELPIRPPLAAPLTLRQLLTHTGGFDEELFGQHAASPEAWSPLAEYLERELPPRFAPPGRVIAYSDFHTSLAGYTLERAAGERFEVLAEERVLRLLGMERTTFRQVELPPAVAGSLATAYGRGGGGLEPYRRDFIRTTPAAGLQASAADMARWLGALLDPGGEAARRVMPPERWLAQRTRQFDHHPELPGKGLGLTQVRRGGHDLWYKDGQASGFHARLVVAPELGIAWFSVHNRSIIDPLGAFNAAARVHRDVGWELLEHLAPADEGPEEGEGAEEQPGPTEPAPGAEERIPRYLGTYRTTVASRHTLEKLLAMTEEIRVEPSPPEAGPGRVDLAGGRYVEVAPGLLQWHEGHDFYAALRLPPGSAGAAEAPPASHLFFGVGAFERIPWWETSRFALWLVGAAAAVFLVAAVGLARPALFPPNRGSAGSASGRDVSFAGWTAAMLELLFLALFTAVLATTDPQVLFRGWPWIFRAVLVLPVAALVPLGWLLVRLPRAWGRAQGRPAARALASAVLVAGLAFTAWLHVWNALGWRF